jgi:alpha-galactosidase
MFVQSLQRDEERQRVDQFIGRSFGPDVTPPLSFRYGGRPSGEFLSQWEFSREERRSDEAKVEYDLVYRESATGLEVRCRCEVFLDFPAVEWVVSFRNLGFEDSPIIEDVQALDWQLERSGDNEFVLHRAEGAYGQGDMSEFAPVDQTMPPRSRVQLAPVEGQSSHITAFPFFNVEASGEGVVVAVGWSGQWAAELERDGGNAMTIRAGMEHTRLRLHPGEQIRTPRILLLFWTDEDRLRGHNMLRRFVLAHHTPLDGDEPVTMPLVCSATGLFDMGNDATEENQIATATRFVELGIEPESYLLDPGWVEAGWPGGSGNWSAKEEAFPNGIRAVSESLKGMGLGLILASEPEMVKKNTEIDQKHPEWVLSLNDGWAGLFNFGDPDALAWMIDSVSAMITLNRVKVFRQQSDWYMDFGRFWRETDEPDRAGITEIRWIEGLYRFWDQLKGRHPGLIIDSCAHGGRRLDLEAISRTIPILRTVDSYGQPHIRVPEARPDPYYGGVCQCHTYALNFWLPCSSTGVNATNTYEFRSAMGAGIVLRWDPNAPEFSVEHSQRMVAEFREARPYFYGDYYPLTAHNIRDDAWIAYQFHRDDLSSGIVLAFRRLNSFDSTLSVHLGGLDPAERYEVTFHDSGEKAVYSGAELGGGLELKLAEPVTSLLAVYRQVAA